MQSGVPDPDSGEETASVVFGAMLDALREGARISGCVETDMIADQVPMHYGTDSTGWPGRHLTPGRGTSPRARAGRGRIRRRGARTVQAVRQLLVQELGWDRRSVLTKPFWAPGEKGLE